MKRLVLASASPRRSELLKQIGLSFDIVPSNIDEDITAGMAPSTFVSELSRRKAESVAGTLGKYALVIGADTVVVKDRIMGKPANEDEALEMLKSLQGGWHEVITGVSLVDSENMRTIVENEVTRVKMRALPESFLRAYLSSGEPMDKAGAYGIQGLGALLVEKLEGCYFNIVGLPLTRLSIMLESMGYKVL